MKIAKTMLTGVTLLSAVGLSLSGCSNQPKTEPQEVKEAPQVQTLTFMESPNPTMNFEDGEIVEPVRSTEDNWTVLPYGDIEVSLYGSSSCPPSVEKVTQEKTTVTVELKQEEAGLACTKDLAGFYITVTGANQAEKLEIKTIDNEKGKELPKK